MIRLIIEIIFFILIFRFVVNIVLPLLNALIFSNSSNNSRNHSGQGRNKTGSIHVDYTPPKQKSKYDNQSGEFIDYEEIK